MTSERPIIPTKSTAQDDGPVIVAHGHCRHISDIAVKALLDMAAEVARDGVIRLGDLQRIGTAILAENGPMSNICNVVEHTCQRALQRVAIERQRRDSFGRLIVEPFVALLDRPDGIERKRLGQFLLAVRMMLGEEEHDSLRNRATALAMRHRSEEGMVNWEAFHADPEAAHILERVQVLIAKSFHRFDGRRDWFLVVLNASPAAVSIGPNSFVPLKAEERAHLAFTQRHMANLFDALFASVKKESFTSDRLRAFSQRWNAPPDKIFANFFVEIARLHMR